MTATVLYMPSTIVHKRQVYYLCPPVAHSLMEKCVTLLMVI